VSSGERATLAQVPRQISYREPGGPHEPLLDELRHAFERVTAGGTYVLGEEVERFEAEFAAYCGVRHCVGVSSGTAALTTSLMAAGIGPGDEVVVPAYTFVATGLSVLNAGATPVLCDVDPGTGLISLDAAAAAVTSRTAAIIAVHLFGQVCDMGAVRSFADRRRLFVLEDAAQAHGARYANRRAGSLGDAAAFSFHPEKNLGALGDAGAIGTSDPGLAERARQLRNLGGAIDGEAAQGGRRDRLDALQAAFLRVKLRRLDEWNERRRAIAAAYREALAGHLRLLEELPESRPAHHAFPVRASRRDALAAWLGAAGIETRVHYWPALHQRPPFRSLPGTSRSLPNAEAWAREELSLPIHPQLSDEDVSRVAEVCLRSSPARLALAITTAPKSLIARYPALARATRRSAQRPE
jgi:dTDP-3-amino-3,4,6-trideoxy-alpha-D-glucose transaminase